MEISATEQSKACGGSKIRPGALFAKRYQIIRVLGKGSLGWVVEALDLKLDGEQVALKILYPNVVADEVVAERLAKEVVVTRQLGHPGIVRTFDLDFDSEFGHFISMECVDGWSLKEILARASSELTLDFKVNTLYGIAQALAFAHGRGVLHRDLRPGNILISKQGTVKLTDFGFARTLDTDSGLTATGELLGSPQYMSPEQFLGEELDCQSDVYSFGILAYELLSGELPWKDNTYLESARMHLEESIPQMPKRAAICEDWLYQLVSRCTQRSPENRFSSAQEIVSFIKDSNGGKVENTAIVVPAVLRKLNRRARTNANLLAAVLILTASALLYAFFSQNVTTSILAPRVLQLEKWTGVPLNPIKRFMRVEGSLLKPQSLMDAVTRGDYFSVKALVAAGADLNTQSPSGETLLHNPVTMYLIALSDFENTETQRLPLEVRDSTGRTPIIQSAYVGGVELIQFLLNRGADFGKMDDAGRAAIHAATIRGNIKVVKALGRRVNIDQLDGDGNTALHIAVHLRNLTVFKLLLSLGANVEIRDSSGRSPLMLVLQQSRFLSNASDFVQTLLNYGASIEARDNQGRSVQDYIKLYADGDISSLFSASPLSVIELSDSVTSGNQKNAGSDK